MIVAYTGTAFSREDQKQIVIDAVAVLFGDYDIRRKQAAILLLKVFLPQSIRKTLLEEDGIYPFDRNDSRVAHWKQKVLEKRKCEYCGATEHLEAHHVLHWADYPKGRADLKNGVCLCHKCHTEEHKHDSSYRMMKAKED